MLLPRPYITAIKRKEVELQAWLRRQQYSAAGVNCAQKLTHNSWSSGNEELCTKKDAYIACECMKLFETVELWIIPAESSNL